MAQIVVHPQEQAGYIHSSKLPLMMNSSTYMSVALAVLLVANLSTKLWLASRQVRHVAQHRDAVPVAFTETITLESHQKAADYTLEKARVGLIDLALDAATLLAWTLLGGLDFLNQITLQLMGPGMDQQVVLVLAFMLIGGLIGLPLSLYQTFSVEQRFGFNKTTPALWFKDLALITLLIFILGTPFIWLILWLMEVGGALWWAWAWVALVIYQLMLMSIMPNLIMPLFNKYTPYENNEIKNRITSLMIRSGFKAKGFFVMDGSKRSSHSNALLTGFGSTKRVVFYDTLLAQLNGDEMEAVLAHELGHFKHRHILQMMATSFAFSLVGLALLGWLSQQVWFYTGLGVAPNLQGGNSALALLLFMLFLPLVTFFITPLSSRRSRRFEFEADAYAANNSDGKSLASALLKLYQDNASTLTPDPWFVAFYYSHPPASQRIARIVA